jgi:hypothetical protein
VRGAVRVLPALLLLAAAAVGAPLEEREPNDTRAQATQEVRPGDTLEGRFEGRSDTDAFLLVLEEPRVLTLRWSFEGRVGVSSIRFGTLLRKGGGPPRETFELHRYRVPSGRHVVEIRGRPSGDDAGYRLAVLVEDDSDGVAAEPDDRAVGAIRLASGEALVAHVSHPLGDVDHVRLVAERHGVHRLIAERLPGPGEAGEPGLFQLSLTGFGGASYVYEVDELDREHRFFPVLGGEHVVTVKHRRGAVGTPYRIRLEPFEVGVDAELERRARRALDGGVGWLLDHDEAPPKKHEVAVAAVELMALVEGSGAADRVEDRRRRSGEILADLAARREPLEGGTWRGEPVRAPSEQIYDLAFTLLALAEARVAGHEKAAEIGEDALRALLASQLSPRRCSAWGTVAEGHIDHGGWRYGPRSRGADVSVTGWALVALYAAANAGFEDPSLVEAADDAVAYVRRCGRPDGFQYQASARGGGTSSVRQGIGSLLGRLFGLAGPARRAAERDVDLHLCAGTQTGHGQNAPFYYWYYATRACWLRGGYAWAAWRSVLLEQLLRRQEEDGSWAPLHEERIGGRRFSTSMAVLLLRLALEEPPAYLGGDVEGF